MVANFGVRDRYNKKHTKCKRSGNKYRQGNERPTGRGEQRNVIWWLHKINHKLIQVHI